MIVEDITAFTPLNVFSPIKDFPTSDVDAFLKIEIFNPAGSIKFKTAVRLINEIEKAGNINHQDTIIETTSGNMGIALAIIAKARGYKFECIADEKITDHNRDLILAYDAELTILPGSTLQDRFAYINSRIEACGVGWVWPRQFDNIYNRRAHESTTALEIMEAFPQVTHVFLGVGTAGTLAGCAEAFRRHGKTVNVIAVDVPGSMHFDEGGDCLHGQAAPARTLPGIGATRRSPFLDSVEIHEVVVVPEAASIVACKAFQASTGWLLGASSGSVLAAMTYSAPRIAPGSTIVGIGADSGERYLKSVYGNDGANIVRSGKSEIRSLFPRSLPICSL